ncbi:GNAT family N-acetyltransferase [Sagittula salina]|uniref:GNAT family N-acetyltransferase n=1 Tax=Sagittula salina TaxID=2820268 RepID=A0A940MM12_9RHOB|nr:GNAT family N-acetyltransferase [Sagittula salina]MBP0480923.1 GNAT family N-acetyltransferase [Sagittula salina]
MPRAEPAWQIREVGVSGHGQPDPASLQAAERRSFAIDAKPPGAASVHVICNAVAVCDPQFVAVADGGLCGWVDILRGAPPLEAQTGTLAMGVLPEWRGQGVGRALLTHALDAARARGFHKVGLEVRSGNIAARKLCEAAGFAVEGVKREAVLMDAVFEDVMVMGLVL